MAQLDVRRLLCIIDIKEKKIWYFENLKFENLEVSIGNKKR